MSDIKVKLNVGKSYQVIGFSDQCPNNYMHRLLAFGFVPGIRFDILGVAPLGNPYEIEIQGVKLSLRKNELNYVKVLAV